MEARRRSGRGAGLQGGGGAQSAVRQMFTRYRSTCVIHCVLVFQLELLFFCVCSSCFVLFPACQRSCASSLWFHNVSCLLSFVPLCLNNRDIFGFQMTLNGSDSDLFSAPFVTIRWIILCAPHTHTHIKILQKWKKNTHTSRPGVLLLSRNKKLH